MTIPALWYGLGLSRGPITQVQPFSYQDDVTFLDILYKQKDYVNTTIVPAINSVGAEVDSALAAQTEYVNNVVTQIIDDSIQVQDPVIAGSIYDPLSETRAAMYAEFGPLKGERGVKETIYVRQEGRDDTGNGKTVDTAFREIRKAVETLASRGPMIRGTVEINVGAGVYKGGIDLGMVRNPSQDDFIRIVGPSVGGHPNVPTVNISFDADNTFDYGIRAYDGVVFRLDNIKFSGAFRYAIDTRRNTYLRLTNVHGVGPGKAVVGSTFFGAIDYVNYYMVGGIISDYERGIQEHGQVRRHFEDVSSLAQGTQILRCGDGIFAKEGCGGHLDYIQISDCENGIIFHTNCNANMLWVTLKRNGVGVFLTASEIHNESRIVYGTGVDANARNILSLTTSSELESMGWTGANARTIDVGHRPLLLQGADYTTQNILGTTRAQAYQLWQKLTGKGMYAVKGKRFEVHIVGSVVASPATAAGIRILMLVGGNQTVELTIPQGAPVGADFEGVFTVVCTTDGNNQKVWSKLSGFGSNGVTGYAPRTLDLMSDSNKTVSVDVINGDATGSVNLQVCELWA